MEPEQRCVGEAKGGESLQEDVERDRVYSISTRSLKIPTSVWEKPTGPSSKVKHPLVANCGGGTLVGVTFFRALPLESEHVAVTLPIIREEKLFVLICM